MCRLLGQSSVLYVILTGCIVSAVKEDINKGPTSDGPTVEATDPDALCPAPDIADMVDWSHDVAPFAVGRTLSIKCENVSDTLLGPSVITCIDPGTWDWDEGKITCKYVVCEEPVVPSNGSISVSADVLRPGSVVQYTCNHGYVLVGRRQLSCMPSGQWTDNAPTCQEECAPLPISDGEFNSQCTQTDCTAFISCHHGFFVIGKNQLTCTSGGTWRSEDVPLCKGTAITCSSPGQVTEGTFRSEPLPNSDHQYIYNTIVTYKCLDDSHILSGNQSLICMDTGNWNSDPPVCADDTDGTDGNVTSVLPTDGYDDMSMSPNHRKCPSLEHVPYATYAITNSSRVVTYTCNLSYQLHGNTQRECYNGTWSGEPPSCIAVRMDHLPWRSIFEDNKEWKGSYIYKNMQIGFKFWFLSSTESSIQTLLLDDLNAKLDLKGVYLGDAIIFEVRRLLVPSEILHDTGWRIRGELTNDTQGWKYSGSVHSTDSGYSTLYMRPVKLVDYEAPPIPADQQYASATALALGIAIAIMAIIIAALLAAYCVKRKGRSKGHRTLTSFENPVYEYENNVNVKVI